MFAFVLSIAAFALLAFTLVDIIRSDPWRFRYLDKVAWVFIVILIPVLGAILWFVVGRERGEASYEPSPPPRRESAPVVLSDEDIDAQVEREIAFHENEARIKRLEKELQAKRELDEKG